MSKFTPKPGDCERRLKRWREIIDTVANQLTDLLWQREQIQRIGRMINENPRLKQSQKPFLWDVRRWYMFFAVLAVRRQADKMDDVYSLHRLLKEIRDHSECIDKNMLIALFRKDGTPRYDVELENVLMDSMWKDFTNERGAFDVDAVVGDLAHLRNISRQVSRLASKSIAHTTKQGLKNETQLTFDDVDQCIDALDKVAVKYIRLLQGAGMSGGTLMPTEQFDWYEEFTFAWRPHAPIDTGPDFRPLPYW